jgi:hypothetical protein
MYYKFLNTISGKSVKVTSQGKKLYENDALLSKQMRFLGECDSKGILLKEEPKAEKVKKEKSPKLEENGEGKKV